MFGFSKEEKTSAKETESSGVWGSQLNAALADVRKAGISSKKRTEKNATSSGTSEGGGGLSSKDVEAVKKMFDPDAWRAIVRAPFALGKAITGRDCWELEKKQEDTLATSTSATAEYFLQTDPKWIVLTLFTFNWTVILTEKFAQNARAKTLEEKIAPKPKEPQVSPVQVVK